MLQLYRYEITCVYFVLRADVYGCAMCSHVAVIQQQWELAEARLATSVAAAHHAAPGPWS